MACATGRSVLAVGDESYALSLYTCWHLEQLDWVGSVVRKSERFDLGGLMSHAMHNPKEITEQHRRFRSALLRPATSAPSRDSAAVLAMVKALHGQTTITQTLVPR